MNADKNERDLAEHVKIVRRRLNDKENLRVDPILDTFDLLHLQEVQLSYLKSNRSKRAKNKRSSYTDQMRRGGAVKR